MRLTLTWRRLEHAYTLDASGEGAERLQNGGAYHLGNRRYRAFAWIGDGPISAEAGSYRAAMHALERVLDRRSIGLFGVDDVDFIDSSLPLVCGDGRRFATMAAAGAHAQRVFARTGVVMSIVAAQGVDNNNRIP